MAPSSLIAKIDNPEAARELARPLNASEVEEGTAVPDFFTFLEGFGKSINFTLELLDQKFANEYLQLNAFQPHPPQGPGMT